jgi:hypothetical protein
VQKRKELLNFPNNVQCCQIYLHVKLLFQIE